MKIHNTDELVAFLRSNIILDFNLYDAVYLNRKLYELLIEQKWDCPLGDELRARIATGLKVVKD